MTNPAASIEPGPQALTGRDVLDVRRRPAYEADTQTLPDARWFDPEQIDRWATELDHARPLLIYCVHGHEVSQTAAQCLQALGFDARFLVGGIEGWREAGLPLQAKRR